MVSFHEFGLNAELLKAIEALGFTEPTPVQAKVIPILLNDTRDVVALAQTGTGKTAAFGLPMLELTDAKKRAVQSLVLCPTRELCLQITKDLTAYGRFAPHCKILAAYGGSAIRPQLVALHQGVHILVATPGRLNDILRRGGAILADVERVILDEADEMLSMGFQEELEAILQEVPEQARTLLFSATMPASVAAIARKFMNDPEEVVLGRRNSSAENVTHECYTVHARDRYDALRRIIDANPGFYGIVFCRTRAETQDIADRLKRDGYPSEALHGDLSQDQRDRVMKGFRVRELQILVATDVASRGLDVNDLTHVVNYDLPDDLDVYLHRSGRTGRAGKDGISIVLAHMRESSRIGDIERLIKKKFAHKKVPTGPQVCAIQLTEILEGIMQSAADGKALDAYMPQITATLADLTHDELARLLVQRDFGRVLAYYRHAPELEMHHKQGGQHERPGRRDHDDSGMATMRVNLGMRDGLSPAILISLINHATRGPKLDLGRIRILDRESIFSIAPDGAEKMMAYLNRSTFENKPVRAEFKR